MVWRALNEIKIFAPIIQNGGRRVVNRLQIPPVLKKYFKTLNFYVEYEKDVSGVPESILNIPALSSIIHFAWAIGYDISIGKIDKDYVDGAEKALGFLRDHPVFSKMTYPANIYGTTVENSFGGEKNGLLFSGGVDSTASYIAHRHEAPQLITIRGIDMPLSWGAYWNRVVDLYKERDITTIVTNTEEIYTKLHWHYFTVRARIVEGYMAGYAFSINRLGVCAPLTVTEGIGNLMMSSTYPSREYGDSRFPWSKDRINAIIDEWLSWADVHVHDVEREYSTTEKIKDLIKPYLENHDTPLIRSCGHVGFLEPQKDKVFNCTRCDKCQRVIGSLAVSGIDPRTCGFNTTEETYRTMAYELENNVWNPIYAKYHWSEVKRHLPAVIEDDFGGSRAFLEWLRDYEFD